MNYEDFVYWKTHKHIILVGCDIYDMRGKEIKTINHLMKCFYSFDLNKNEDTYKLFEFIKVNLKVDYLSDKELSAMVFSLYIGKLTFSELIKEMFDFHEYV